jgi:hypothetical protein
MLRSGGTGAGRLWTGGSEVRLWCNWSGGGGADRPEALDRVVARAFGLVALGSDDRMPDRAMWDWFLRIISGVRVG